MRHGAFGRPASPYHALLRRAGCELGDAEALVRGQGVEGALERLRAAGVYVTFEEFKGRSPILRDGLHLPASAEAFGGLRSRRSYRGRTGGTSGRGTPVPLDLDHLAAQAPHEMVAMAAHDLLAAPAAVWLPLPPSLAAPGVILRQARCGRSLERWFSPLGRRELGFALRDSLATLLLWSGGRLTGRRVPRPERVPLDRADRIARWMSRTVAHHGSCVLITHVSCAVRVCVAAQAAGIDLAGAVMWGGSEPPTPSKVGRIRAAGARWIPGYWMIEAGFLGQGCRHPQGPNDIHLFRDAFAVVQHPVSVASTGVTAPACYLTTLLPTAPKLMLNVEIDDSGVLEERPCGCPLAELGYTQHLRDISSLRKLTGEGITLLGSDLVRILEEVLPARFGGTPLDYQLLEEEDASGLTRVLLLISPRVGPVDPAAAAAALLAGLGEAPGPALARATWRQAGSLRVERREPIPTAQGKLLPLATARRISPTTAGR